MKKLGVFFLRVMAAISLLWVSDLSATSIRGMVISCPVCNERLNVMFVSSTNNFGGDSRDFLSHAVGSNPIDIDPITCTRCLFSGYMDDFERKNAIPEPVKDNILKGKILKPLSLITSVLRYDQIPAWQRYDLIAQTYQLLNKDKKTIAYQYLKASWAIRLNYDPLSNLNAKTNNKVRDYIQKYWDEEAAKSQNRALYEILLGKEFAQKAKALKGEQRLMAAYAAIYLLRSHGENTSVKQVLPPLKTVETENKYVKVQQSLKKSISLEQFFQTKAVLLFEEAGEELNDPSEKASLCYLCGELNRRMGNWTKAKHFFDKCEEMAGLPKRLAQYVREQKELLPK